MINKNVFVVSLIFFCNSVEIPAPPSQFYSYRCHSFIVQQRFYQPMDCVFDSIVTLFISDLFIGLHATIPFVYASFILIALLGRYVKKINISTVLLSSTLFFLVSNFGVWLLHYPISVEGLVQCYTLALPFFLNTVLGDLVYGALLIYPFYALQRRNRLAV